MDEVTIEYGKREKFLRLIDMYDGQLTKGSSSTTEANLGKEGEERWQIAGQQFKKAEDCACSRRRPFGSLPDGTHFRVKSAGIFEKESRKMDARTDVETKRD